MIPDMVPSTLPRVTAIILHYNETEHTIECIRSLEKAEYPALHVMVVDNGSRDDPASRLRGLFPEVEIRSTGENLGYTGGINAGFRFARERSPDYILVLNPDTEVRPDFLNHLVNAMETRPRAAGACGTIFTFHDPTLVWYAGGRMVPWRGLATHDLKNQRLDPATLGPPRTVSFITGCMILFRTSLLAAVGQEDERFFMYLDDIEFSARIVARGYELLYVPRSVIFHKVLGEEESPLKLYYSVRNRLLLIRSAFHGLTGLVAMVWFLTAIGGKLGVWFFTKHDFFRAARMGLTDYARGRLYRGRGVEAFGYRKDL